MPEAGAIVDPYRAYNFKLAIQGVVEGHFTACEGLGVNVTVVKYREGTNPVVRAIPGQVEYLPITLYYGVTSSRELFDWLMTAVDGRVERKNISVLMLDPEGVNEIFRWNLLNAWVASWRGAHLDALKGDLAIENVTIVYERLERT